MKYKVDGEWRDLKIRKETIKVKDKEPIELNVRQTHRGPIMNSELLADAEVLFSEGLPALKNNDQFSLAWSGHANKENTISLVR